MESFSYSDSGESLGYSSPSHGFALLRQLLTAVHIDLKSPAITIEKDLKEHCEQQRSLENSIQEGHPLERRFEFCNSGLGGLSVLARRTGKCKFISEGVNSESATLWGLLQRKRYGMNGRFSVSNNAYESLLLEGYMDATSNLGADYSFFSSASGLQDLTLTVQGISSNALGSMVLEQQFEVANNVHPYQPLLNMKSTKLSIPMVRSNAYARLQLSRPNVTRGREFQFQISPQHRSCKMDSKASPKAERFSAKYFSSKEDSEESDNEASEPLGFRKSSHKVTSIPEITLNISPKNPYSRNFFSWNQQWSKRIRTKMRLSPIIYTAEARWNILRCVMFIGQATMAYPRKLQEIRARLILAKPARPKPMPKYTIHCRSCKDGDQHNAHWKHTWGISRRIKGGFHARASITSRRIQMISPGGRARYRSVAVDAESDQETSQRESSRERENPFKGISLEFEIYIPF